MSRSAPTLEEIDATAARWVARRDAGLSAREQAEFDQWCDASPLHAEAVARFDTTWAALGRPRRTGVAPVLRGELGQLLRRQRQRRAGFAAAACALVLAAGSLWWAQRPLPSPVAAVAPLAAHTTILQPERRELPDGSAVELRAGAAIEVDFSGALRRVTLRRGEAHFAVAKDSSRPFVVSAGGVEVRAVGTAFSVQLGESQVEVLVTEGRVAVAADAARTKDQGPGTKDQGPRAKDQGPVVSRATALPHSLAPIYVDAGNRLAVEVALQPVALPAVLPVKPAEAAELLAWRTPRVEFSGAPLSEVIAVLNRYHETKFVIGDPALATVPLSGLFRADDTEVFTGLLKTGFGIETELRGGEIVLRKGP